MKVYFVEEYGFIEIGDGYLLYVGTREEVAEASTSVEKTQEMIDRAFRNKALEEMEVAIQKLLHKGNGTPH